MAKRLVGLLQDCNRDKLDPCEVAFMRQTEKLTEGRTNGNGPTSAA